MIDRIPGFTTGMIPDPDAHHGVPRTFAWLRLKRLAGLAPAVPLTDQEGQLRYTRGAASTEGYAVLAKMGASDVMAWHRFLTYPYGTPSVTAQAGAGSTAVVSVDGNDTTGVITITPGGAGIAAGNLVILTFATARPNTSYTVVTTPSSTAARALTTPLARSARNTGSVTLANATALTSGSTYTWDYLILG